MVRKVLGIILALGLLGAARGWSQDVSVIKTVGGKSSFDLSGFNPGRDEASTLFFRTIKADLTRSGWFTISTGAGEFRMLGASELRGNTVEVKCQVFNTAQSRSVLSKSFSAPTADARRLAHAVADAVVEAATGRPGFASSRMALVGNRTGRKELYLCDADGANMVQLTNHKSISLAPQWSSDAKQIVYTSYMKGAPDVYLIDLPTGQLRRLAGFPGLNTGGALSPDGRYLALVLSRDGNPELYVRDMRSGGLNRITRTERAAESSPSWSPDGRRLVFVSDLAGSPQLYLIDRDGGEPRRLTSRGSENVAPDWGANNLITCASRSGGRYGIVVIDPATMAVREIPLDGADYEDPSWARDGRHIACARSERYRSAIYLVDTMGDKPIPLVNYDGDWFSPSWTP